MTDQTLKLSGMFTFVMSQYLRDCDAGIIVTDAFGDTSEKIKRSDMGLQKGFCTFARERHHKHGIGMNHAHHKKHDFFQDTVKLDNRMTEVHLSFAGSLT